MSIIDAFDTLAKPLNYQFNDKVLRQVANQTHKRLDEVVDTIARYYLCNFPTTDGVLFFSQSNELKKRYGVLHPLYGEIVQALNDGKDVRQLPSVGAYLAGFSGIGGNRKERVIEQLQQQALMVHEVTRTFPKRFDQVAHLVKFVEDDMTEEIYQYLDGEITTFNPTKMVGFFYKHYAIPGKTWAELAKDWVTTGGNSERLSKFVNAIPLSWIFPIKADCIHPTHSLSFRDYTQKKTWEAFLEMLGVKADLPVPKELQDEAFRMDLVFYMSAVKREGLIAEKPDPQTKAYKWLLAARRFLRLQNEMELGNRAGEVLMWCLRAKQPEAQFKEWDEFSKLDPKEKSDGKHIELVAGVEEGMDEEAFLQYALIYLLILEKESKHSYMNSTYQMLESFDRTYCAFDPKELRLFLQRNAFIDFTLAQGLPGILSQLRCQGKSPIFFHLIIDILKPWDFQRCVRPTKEILRRLNLFPLNTHRTLQVLGNVMSGKINNATLDLLFPFEAKFGQLSQEDRALFLCSDLIMFPTILSADIIESVLKGLGQIRLKMPDTLPWELMGMGCFLASINDRKKIEERVSQMTEQPALQKNIAFAMLADNAVKVYLPKDLSSYNADAILWGMGQLNQKFTISADDMKKISNQLASLEHPQKIGEKVSSVLDTYEKGTTLTATQFAQQRSAPSAVSSDEC